MDAKAIQDLLQFLDSSLTAWHATKEVCIRLKNAGFIELQDKDSWHLEKGKSYFVNRSGSSLCAFTIPKQTPEKASIIAAHTDSPSLKLKANPEFVVKDYIMFGVEPYGAPLLTSWLNRDLGIAGRIIFSDEKFRVYTENVNLSSAPLVIAQLAIHLDREVNEKGLLLNKQEHLAAIACLKDDSAPEEPYLHFLLRNFLKGRKLLSHDLFLYPLEKAAFLGNKKELIASSRLDNLVSVFASIEALIKAKKTKSNAIQMAIFWDNEEIGSQTMQGADSPFLLDVLNRIAMHFELSQEEALLLKLRSFCTSVDLTHALHPNYIERHEPRHQLAFGKGIVIKSNAQQRYATDGVSAAFIANLCNKHDIPFQHFACRSDMPCGSTIGPINASRSGIKTVDIGIPELSMHSIREIIASKDYLFLTTLLKHILEESNPNLF